MGSSLQVGLWEGVALGRPSRVRTRESDRVDRGVHGRGGHCGEVKKKVPLSPNSLQRSLPATPCFRYGYTQALRKEGSEKERRNPAAWKGAETGRIWLLGTPVNHPRGGVF